jgi:hypothetical protein
MGQYARQPINRTLPASLSARSAPAAPARCPLHPGPLAVSSPPHRQLGSRQDGGQKALFAWRKVRLTKSTPKPTMALAPRWRVLDRALAKSYLNVQRTFCSGGSKGTKAPMFFTFPEDARRSAERQIVQFGVQIGECHGLVRVPRRVFQRLLIVANARALRRSLPPTADPLRAHCRAQASPAPVDRGRERRDQRT